MTRPTTYRGLDEDPSYEHSVDQAVRVRVGQRGLDRQLVRTTTEIVKTLGAKRRRWIDYERVADELRAKRG